MSNLMTYQPENRGIFEQSASNQCYWFISKKKRVNCFPKSWKGFRRDHEETMIILLFESTDGQTRGIHVHKAWNQTFWMSAPIRDVFSKYLTCSFGGFKRFRARKYWEYILVDWFVGRINFSIVWGVVEVYRMNT